MARETQDLATGHGDLFSERCIVCGAAATLLCDGHLGWKSSPLSAQYGVAIMATPPSIHTCDAPLCAKCTAKGTVVWTCGRTRGHGCEPYRDDLCPACVGKGLFGSAPPQRPILDREVDQVRAERHAQARQQRHAETP